MPDIKTLMDKLGYAFHNETLLKKALTHSSYANEGRQDVYKRQRLR